MPSMLRLIHWIATRIGRWAARLLLYPITLYFLLRAGAARRASREYLRRVLGHEPGWRHIFRHIFCFGTTILDRVYFLGGQIERFDVRIHQPDVFFRQVEKGRGCILLGSHLGSFEVLRVLAVSRPSLRLRVLMDVEHNRDITRLLDAINPEIAATVIAPGRPDTLLKVKESLDAGYLIGTLGDRVGGDRNTARCRFLGAPAEFPAGPVLLAAVMKCPVVLFFGLYRGGNRYDVHFELFAEQVMLDRNQRQQAVEDWTQQYATRLEHYARQAPYNWFNFYPFWYISREQCSGSPDVADHSRV